MDLGAALFFTEHSMPAVELAEALEARGYESMWAPEHSHIPMSRSSAFPAGGELPKEYSECLDPFVVLAMAGAVTKRLKLGTGVCLVVQRDPIQTAKLVASLDQATGGRFLFGVGNGWNAEEMADHGTTDFKGRHRLARERIEAMKAIWTQEVASYSGDLVQFGDMTAWPKPTQKPHPPVIVGGAFPYAARRAIAYGNGWIPHASRQHYGDVSEFLPQFHQMAREAGRDPSELPVTVWGSNVDPDDIKRLRDRGVSRVVVQLKTAGRDTVLPMLDRFASLIPDLRADAP
jgi:probable F420-dependent oxidoreductase